MPPRSGVLQVVLQAPPTSARPKPEPAKLSKKETQIADLQENIKSQQAESSKDKDELTSALAAIEKLKGSFKNERAGWATEKSTLLKRDEDAEAALNPVVEELTGLKQQINAMTAAIFGSHVTHLGSDMRQKLKAAYTLIEQLYTGVQQVICTTSYNKVLPTLIKESLEKLAMIPARLEELKKSVARAGALTALTRAKAWISDLNPADLANVYPSIKEDGSEFDVDALGALTREMRPLASKLAEETNLSHYQPIYDANNKRVKAPTHDVPELIPPIRKHTYAPDVDPSTLISDETVFKSLTEIDWTNIDFQPLGR
ncbi:uncharacterized protein [Triticum aestivum]|uniref:uncharacterized protein n=1 Tax=Triticum aestivum TaxID=4565 RepID=UPI001D002DB7|nr:uncharacterized protein LOC123083782 [Triticum aestivum]